MPFFKPSQDIQILFIFQFIQLFSPRRTYSRPISNSLYQYPIFQSYNFSKLQILFYFLLQLNLTSKFSFLLSLYFSLTRDFSYSYLLLRVLNLTYLILKILYYRKLLSYTYSYIFKLSYYSLLQVFIRYRSLNYPPLLQRILGISYLKNLKLIAFYLY